MLLTDLLGWWYGRGWKWAIQHQLKTRNARILEFFSVGALSKTLFAPFRQTYTGSSQGSLGARLRALGDQTISRAIGLVVRLTLIVAAAVLMVANSIVSVASIIVWPLVPVSPLLGLLLCFLGVKQ